MRIVDPLTLGSILVPEIVGIEYPENGPPSLVWLEGNRRLSPPPRGCLEAFLKLASAPDERIDKFARLWGPLGICEHGRTSSHDVRCEPLDFRQRFWERNVLPVGIADHGLPHRHWERDQEERSLTVDTDIQEEDVVPAPQRFPRLEWLTAINKALRDDTEEDALDLANLRDAYWEPLAAWRFLARKFRAILELAKALAEERPTRQKEVWLAASLFANANGLEDLRGAAWEDPADGLSYGLKMAAEGPDVKKQQLLVFVNDLIVEASVRSIVTWHDWRPAVTLTVGRPIVPVVGDEEAPGLYGLLVSLLVAAMTTPDRFYVCDDCGDLYERPEGGRRAPRRDKPGRCDECAEKARRRRKRDDNRRRRAAQKLALGG